MPNMERTGPEGNTKMRWAKEQEPQLVQVGKRK